MKKISEKIHVSKKRSQLYDFHQLSLDFTSSIVIRVICHTTQTLSLNSTRELHQIHWTNDQDTTSTLSLLSKIIIYKVKKKIEINKNLSFQTSPQVHQTRKFCVLSSSSFNEGAEQRDNQPNGQKGRESMTKTFTCNHHINPNISYYTYP